MNIIISFILISVSLEILFKLFYSTYAREIKLNKKRNFTTIVKNNISTKMLSFIFFNMRHIYS